MLKGVQNISFNGIYDLRVPENTPKYIIDDKAKATEDAIKEFFNVDDLDSINIGIKVQPNDSGIRLVTAVDNPWMMVELFKRIGGEKLAKEYVNRNAQEYKLNINV